MKEPIIKYREICEGWAVRIHGAKDAQYRSFAELTLCNECYEDWKKDHNYLNNIKD